VLHFGNQVYTLQKQLREKEQVLHIFQKNKDEASRRFAAVLDATRESDRTPSKEIVKMES
jgi:septal ring factor EnvC (AmiA/AmiB activator)